MQDQATRRRTPTVRAVHTRDAVARPLARWWRSRRHPASSDRNGCADASPMRPTVRPMMAQLPNAAAGARTIPLRQLREFEVRFLQQKSRARRCTAASDDRAFQNRRGDARGRKGVRHQGSGHAATHYSDSRVELTRQRRISLLDSCGVGEPQGPSDAQPLRRAQRRHSDDGFHNQASSRSRGQQLTILSTGIAASRACANAVSA